jgi:tetratricopeptide (TPR) repeat protein
MNSSTDIFSVALEHHQSGRLDAAAEIYQDILAVAPRHADARHLLGLVAFQAGNYEVAIGHIQRAIQMKKGVAVYHANLGVAYHMLKKYDEAAASFRQAVKLAPNNAENHNNLAKALAEQGRVEDAVRSWRRAVALKPNYADAWSNLAVALSRLGRTAESIACRRELVRLLPESAECCNNLGSALNDQGNLEESIALFHRAIQIDPNFALPHNNLGNALQQRGQLAEACHCYQRAIELKPDLAEAYVGLASTQNELGNSAAAIQHYQSAIRIRPGLAPAHHNLGVVRQEQGDFVKAEESFRAALAADPRYVPAHADLAALLRRRLPAADMAAQEEFLLDAKLSLEQRAALHFGLAQVYDAGGAYERAAEHANTANALRTAHWKDAGQAYDPQAHAAFVHRIISEFTPDFFARVRDGGLQSERPVFVVGLPRSGTTLLEQILASHPEIFGAGELTLTRDAFSAVCGGPQPDAIHLSGLNADRIRETAIRHLGELGRRNATALRVVDKLPENYHYLGFLAALFPRARFIHCRRDLRDVGVSCWMANFREVRWASQPEHLAARFLEYRRFMDHWRRVLPAPILDVSYEETVTDLEAVARRLISWCGLEWDAGCLGFHRGQRTVRTASAVQVRQPLYATSVGRWRNYEKPLAAVLAAVNSLDRP